VCESESESENACMCMRVYVYAISTHAYAYFSNSGLTSMNVYACARPDHWTVERLIFAYFFHPTVVTSPERNV